MRTIRNFQELFETSDDWLRPRRSVRKLFKISKISQFCKLFKISKDTSKENAVEKENK